MNIEILEKKLYDSQVNELGLTIFYIHEITSYV